MEVERKSVAGVTNLTIPISDTLHLLPCRVCVRRLDALPDAAKDRAAYTQYPIIRNGLIRNNAEFLGKFKKRALGILPVKFRKLDFEDS